MGHPTTNPNDQACPTVLFRGSSDGTLDSHEQSHLSHVAVGSHRILMADLDSGQLRVNSEKNWNSRYTIYLEMVCKIG